MSALYSDTTFAVSHGAYERLMASAKQAGIPLARYFRIKASQLVRMADPRFKVTGAMLAVRLDVGLSHRVLDGLRELCTDLGVPFACSGELVAYAAFDPVIPA